LERVIPDLISVVHGSDLLLSPSSESREVLWSLILSFLEPLCKHLTFGQVSQLLFVAVALAAKPQADPVVELAGSVPVQEPLFEEQELVDKDKLDRVLVLLSAHVQADKPEVAAFSLDSLDDDFDAPPPSCSAASEARVAQEVLFQRAFPQILSCIDDSFPVLRSVLYLTPLAILTSQEHSHAVLNKLSSFCAETASSTTRSAGHALGVHLSLRCAQFLKSNPSSVTSLFLWNLFQLMGRTQMEGIKQVQHLSYMVLVSGLSLWRRFFLHPQVDPRTALFPPADFLQVSKPLEWLSSLVADQELYKRFHAALEHAETATTGRDKDGFVVKKAKQLREEAEHRASVTRVLAASILLLILRRMLQNRDGIPWSKAHEQPGSPAALFRTAASLFRTSEPTMDPPFVKPTPAYMVLYASEIIRLLLHLNAGIARTPRPFCLVDDAAQAIHHLDPPACTPQLPLDLNAEQREALVMDFVGALVDLNLTLPPDPHAKHAPANLDGAHSGDIILGWEDCLKHQEDGCSDFLHTSTTATGNAHCAASGSAVPGEVLRVLSQSPECLGWNAALNMYALGVDLSVVCKDGFQSGLVKWRRRKEQARVLIAADLIDRAKRILGLSNRP